MPTQASEEPTGGSPASPVENTAAARKRSTFELTAENAEMIYQDASRRGLTGNAALNMALEELREWRSGMRVFRRKKK